MSGTDGGRPIDHANELSAREAAALAHGEACRQSFADDIEGVDLLMVPGALGEAPKATSTGHDEFVAMWTILHGPDVSAPVGVGSGACRSACS